jgi:hypothetical protein
MQINSETLNISINIQESGFLWKDSSLIGIVINEIFNIYTLSVINTYLVQAYVKGGAFIVDR